MAGQRLRVGIIGFGRIASAHAEAALHLREDIELSAVSTRSVDKSEELVSRFNIRQVYPDYHDLLEDSEIDAVLVCLPNHLHHAVCIDAAHAGKHILVEKPMALNLQEAQEMVEAAHKHGVTLMVGQSRRFSDALCAMRRKMPEIGSPFRLDINFLVSFPEPPTEWWRSAAEAGGLVILLQGSHSIDTIVWLLDKLPTSVFALSRSLSPYWEGEDEANIVLGFDSGELGSVNLSLNTSPYHHEMIVVGPRGTMKLIESPTEKLFGFSYRLEINGRPILDGDQAPSLYAVQLKEFADAIVQGREPCASGQEVRKTMLVLDGIRRSDQSGQVVHVDPGAIRPV